MTETPSTQSEDQTEPKWSSQPNDPNYHCGYIALVGRPNVGKSSLLNQIVGQKISIISAKRQTTRNRILGILTTDQAQYVFIDTPGIHEVNRKNATNKNLNRRLNRTAISSIPDADVIVFMLDATTILSEDHNTYQKVIQQSGTTPILIALNKIDLIKNKNKLLPLIAQIQQKTGWSEIVPISAHTNDNVSLLLDYLYQYTPISPPIFSPDKKTDQREKFIIEEIIREKLTNYLNQELPYNVAVRVTEIKQDDQQIVISAVIYVTKAGQKLIVIGKKGETLKRIGTESRKDINKILKQRSHLNLWVKVKSDWAENDRFFSDEHQSTLEF